MGKQLKKTVHTKFVDMFKICHTNFMRKVKLNYSGWTALCKECVLDHSNIGITN